MGGEKERHSRIEEVSTLRRASETGHLFIHIFS